MRCESGDANNPATEVGGAASRLHRSTAPCWNSGIIWGDAKPDNVLIDSNQDAWVVDFGGGYTEGWVPKQLAETMEGDRHGLEKIVEFIGI